jgi:hypothetical protein
LLCSQDPLFVLLLAFVFFLGRTQIAQFGVPVRFKLIGYQTIVGIHL